MGERDESVETHPRLKTLSKSFPTSRIKVNENPRLQPLLSHGYRLVLILIWRWTRESKKKKKKAHEEPE